MNERAMTGEQLVARIDSAVDRLEFELRELGDDPDLPLDTSDSSANFGLHLRLLHLQKERLQALSIVRAAPQGSRFLVDEGLLRHLELVGTVDTSMLSVGPGRPRVDRQSVQVAGSGVSDWHLYNGCLESLIRTGELLERTADAQLKVEIEEGLRRYLLVGLANDRQIVNLEAKAGRGKTDLYVQRLPEGTCVLTAEVKRYSREAVLEGLKQLAGYLTPVNRYACLVVFNQLVQQKTVQAAIHDALDQMGWERAASPYSRRGWSGRIQLNRVEAFLTVLDFDIRASGFGLADGEPSDST